MVSLSLAKLLQIFGSSTPIGRFTLAVLTSVPVAPALNVPLATKVATPPFARLTSALILPAPLGLAQLDPPDALHVHVTLVNAVVKTLFTFNPDTVCGPLFEMVIVYVFDAPGGMLVR